MERQSRPRPSNAASGSGFFGHGQNVRATWSPWVMSSPHVGGQGTTQLGLRFFVDTLLSVEPWQEDRVEQFENESIRT